MDNKGYWIAAGVALSAAVVVAGTAGVYIVTDMAKAATRERVITLEITGTTGTASVTYSGPSGISQVADAPLPWRQQVTVTGKTIVSFSGRVSSDNPEARVRCAAYLDGEPTSVVNESAGSFTMVTCSGMLP